MSHTKGHNRTSILRISLGSSDVLQDKKCLVGCFQKRFTDISIKVYDVGREVEIRTPRMTIAPSGIAAGAKIQFY
jgi:hypothetical protein